MRVAFMSRWTIGAYLRLSLIIGGKQNSGGKRLNENGRIRSYCILSLINRYFLFNFISANTRLQPKIKCNEKAEKYISLNHSCRKT